jgi:hypothetical protein
MVGAGSAANSASRPSTLHIRRRVMFTRGTIVEARQIRFTLQRGPCASAATLKVTETRYRQIGKMPVGCHA